MASLQENKPSRNEAGKALDEFTIKDEERSFTKEEENYNKIAQVR